nr:uncharacterized protein LOC102116633 [Macaca fascicularis]
MAENDAREDTSLRVSVCLPGAIRERRLHAEAALRSAGSAPCGSCSAHWPGWLCSALRALWPMRSHALWIQGLPSIQEVRSLGSLVFLLSLRLHLRVTNSETRVQNQGSQTSAGQSLSEENPGPAAPSPFPLHPTGPPASPWDLADEAERGTAPVPDVTHLLTLDGREDHGSPGDTCWRSWPGTCPGDPSAPSPTSSEKMASEPQSWSPAAGGGAPARQHPLRASPGLSPSFFSFV